jgi:hypothetical protein
MARKRSSRAAHLSNYESEELEFEDVQCSQQPSFDADTPPENEAHSDVSLVIFTKF